GALGPTTRPFCGREGGSKAAARAGRRGAETRVHPSGASGGDGDPRPADELGRVGTPDEFETAPPQLRARTGVVGLRVGGGLAGPVEEPPSRAGQALVADQPVGGLGADLQAV